MKINLKITALILLMQALMNTVSSQTANYQLQQIYQKMMQAKDYTVQANIKVDLPFIKMLPIQAKIYFKQKDKFKVDSKSIAIVPRQGFEQLTKMLNDTNSFSSLISGIEKTGAIETSIINIIPLADTSDLILGKVWIDKQKMLVLKSQLTTKLNGTILTEYTYGSQVNYGLPDQMIFTVDIKKFKIPKSVSADINNAKVKEENKNKKEKKGKIFIRLSQYQINKGLDDKIFLKVEK